MRYDDLHKWLIDHRKDYPDDARIVILVKRSGTGWEQRFTMHAVPYITGKFADGRATITHFWEGAPLLATLPWKHNHADKKRFDARKVAFRNLVNKVWGQSNAV